MENFEVIGIIGTRNLLGGTMYEDIRKVMKKLSPYSHQIATVDGFGPMTYVEDVARKRGFISIKFHTIPPQNGETWDDRLEFCYDSFATNIDKLIVWWDGEKSGFPYDVMKICKRRKIPIKVFKSKMPKMEVKQ